MSRSRAFKNTPLEDVFIQVRFELHWNQAHNGEAHRISQAATISNILSITQAKEQLNVSDFILLSANTYPSAINDIHLPDCVMLLVQWNDPLLQILRL